MELIEHKDKCDHQWLAYSYREFRKDTAELITELTTVFCPKCNSKRPIPDDLR